MKISRREWLAFAVLASCAKKAATGYNGYALVATAGENSVAAVDLTSFQLVKQIEVGASPSAVIAAQNSSLVLTPSTGSVHVLDGALRQVSSHKLADELSAIRLDAGRTRLVAMAAQAEELIVADAMSLNPIRRHKLDGRPVALDVASTPYAAVSTGGQPTVELFHLQTGQRWRAQMAGEIGALRFRADGQLLLVAGLHDRSLAALQVPGLQTVAELPLGMAPEQLCFTSDAGQLFVSGAGMDAVAIVFPYDTLEVEQTVLTGREPGVMACSANPAYLFVASRSTSHVYIMDVANRKLIGNVAVGEKPVYIAVTPDSQYALVLDELSGDMAVIHVSAIRADWNANWKKSGAALFTVVPVGSKPLQAAVVPRQPV
jgi:YVTN family beta-propeller protein